VLAATRKQAKAMASKLEILAGFEGLDLMIGRG
jgi:hypothetical protein